MHDLRASLVDPDGRRRLASLIVLIIASLATIATTASAASLQAKASGQVDVGDGSMVVRSLVIHLDRASGDAPGSGGLTVDPTTVDGTHGASIDGLAIAVVDSAGVPLPSSSSDRSWFQGELPVSTCTPSCDLAYRLVFTSTDPAATSAVVRFDVDVEFGFPQESGPVAAGQLTLQLDGPPVVNGQWIAIVAAFFGLIGGLVASRGLVLHGRARFVPGVALVGILLAAAISSIAVPTSVDAAFWDTGPLFALALGLSYAIRRWSRGAPEAMVTAAHAVVVIGGILFVGTVGLLPGFVPLYLIMATLALWGLVGVVNGQAFSIYRPTGRLRLWPTSLAVVSQGIILLGLGGYLVSGLLGAYLGPGQFPLVGLDMISVVVVIAALLVVVGLRRWFGGRGAVMAWVNVLLGIVGGLGLLGMSALSSSTSFGGQSTFLVQWGPAAVVSLGACLGGFIAALVAPPRPARSSDPALGALDPSGLGST